jgi:hypothetical protein
MRSISRTVELLIEKNPFIQEALSRGIINNAALSEELIPDIEKELGKKVKFSAVNMAVRRLSEKLQESFVKKASFDKNADITLKSNLIEVNLYKIGDVQDYIKNIYGLVNFKKGDFLTITQGIHEVMILTNKSYEKEIMNILPKQKIKKVFKNVSSLTINIPENSFQEAGLFYLITRAMAWENISIIDTISTFSEVTLIVDSSQAARSFDVIKKLIEEQ